MARRSGILAYIATVAIVVGATTWLFLQIAACLVQPDWRRLASAGLIPFRVQNRWFFRA
jgi:hypothetical protein